MKKQLHLLLVLFFVNLLSAQSPIQPYDCINAITVKGNGVFTSEVASGFGKQEVAGCSSQEHNTVWLRVDIAQSGTLGFDLIPNDPSISADFDFWVFGPNNTCSSLGGPIRCCATNPAQAGLTSNVTGMNGSALATTAWSGGGGNNLSYVRWLTVNLGETYYIAIDRPYAIVSGNNGFQIKWTGTATISSTPTPSANAIPDYLTCTTTPNVAIFNLNDVRSQINSDLTNNTITFYTTLANAKDGINPLQDIYQNTSNPQTIYAKVTSNVGGNYAITNFNLRTFPVPTASIASSKPVVCPGGVIITFTGTPGATVDYTVNGGSVQSVLLDTSGTFLLSNGQYYDRTYTFTLVKAKIVDGNNVVKCFQSLTDTKTVTVNAAPTISGSNFAYVGGSTQLIGSGVPATSNAWTSSNPSIATVSSTGLVSGISPSPGAIGIFYTDINGCSRGPFDFWVLSSNLGVENPAIKDFNAKVYPNPFNTAFVIDVNTLNQEPMKIKVYDMLGRLVEQMEGNPDKMADQKIGQNYASGIYNVVIRQEEQVKTLRIIKE